MLTRRSRKDVGSPTPVSDSKQKVTPKSKRTSSRTPKRSASRSVEKKIRTRSRSFSKKNSVPKVVLERVDIKSIDKPKRETRSRKPELVNSTFKKSPTPIRNTDILNEKRSPSPLLNSNDRAYENHDDQSSSSAKTISSVQFGGTFGNVLLTVLFPVLVILAKIAIKAKGNLIPFPKGYLRFSNYYDQDVFIWTTAIVFLQLVISCIPLAKKTKALYGAEPPYYRFSGFVNLIIGVAIIFTMHYYKCPLNYILEMATKKSVPFVVVSVLIALILAILLFLKNKYSKQTDHENNSLNFLQKIFVGTSDNPTIKFVNVKLALFRYSILMTVLFNSLVILDTLGKPINLHLYFVAGWQIFYAVEKLAFEFVLLPSFYLNKEKDGYWTIVQQLLQPAINFLPIQILLAKNLPVNYIILSVSSVICLLGYICQRYSDLIKYCYETDSAYTSHPFGTKFIQTINGKKIIVSGLWSYIKYPNYLGTILFHLALIIPTIEPNLNSLQTSWPVFLYALYYIVTLAHRCTRILSYCQLKYGFVPNNYYAVKWNLIPKIF